MTTGAVARGKAIAKILASRGASNARELPGVGEVLEHCDEVKK